MMLKSKVDQAVTPAASWVERNVPGMDSVAGVFRNLEMDKAAAKRAREQAENPEPRKAVQMQREFANDKERDEYLARRKQETDATSSDEKTKKDVRFGGPMASAMRSMEPKVYEYKAEFAADEGQRPGDKNVGPMAQAMDKDPVASTVIVHDPDTGLMGIDKAKGLKLALGSLADLQRQLDDLKGRKKGKAS